MAALQNSLIKLYHGDIMNQCDLMPINPIYHNEQENNNFPMTFHRKKIRGSFHSVIRAEKACNID